VSHPSEHKNHLALVRALPHIVLTNTGASLLLTLDRTCPGDARYLRFVSQIAAEADRLRVGDRIAWLGRLTPDEVAFSLREADLLVFPSLAESFGLGLVEAMQAACPIAASDLPYAREVAGDAAVYFDPRSPLSIAGKVSELLRAGPVRERVVAAGLDRVGRYSYPIIAGQITDILDGAHADLVHRGS